MEPPFLEIVTEIIAVSSVQSALLSLLPKRVNDDVYVEEKGLLSPITYITGHGSLTSSSFPFSLLIQSSLP